MTSIENMELVRRAIAANRTGGVEASLAFADPEIELRSVLAGVEGGTYRGHDGIRRYFDDMSGSWEGWSLEAGEVAEVGPDMVLAEVLFRATGRDSGVPVEGTNTIVFQLSEGRALRIHSYTTRVEALRAAGLEE